MNENIGKYFIRELCLYTFIIIWKKLKIKNNDLFSDFGYIMVENCIIFTNTF